MNVTTTEAIALEEGIDIHSMAPTVPLTGHLTAKGGVDSFAEGKPRTLENRISTAFSVVTTNDLGNKITMPVRMFTGAVVDGRILYNGKPNPFATVELQYTFGGSARGGGVWINGLRARFGAPVEPVTSSVEQNDDDWNMETYS